MSRVLNGTSLPLPCYTNPGTLYVLVNAYSEGVKSLVSVHASLRAKTIVQRPDCPWYTDGLHKAKHRRGKLDSKWRTSRLTVEHQIYRNQCVILNKLLRESRVAYYFDKLNACGRDTKGIYRLRKHLLGESDKCSPIR